MTRATRQRLALFAVVAVASYAAVAPGAHGTASLASCHASVLDGVLPSWARSGFNAPRPQMTYELGRAQRIAAILWADPLRSPPVKGRNNKILWVARGASGAGGSALWLRAQRMSGTRRIGHAVSRVVAGGPGPSVVDLPAPGCWRVRLTWSGGTDTLDLRYR